MFGVFFCLGAVNFLSSLRFSVSLFQLSQHGAPSPNLWWKLILEGSTDKGAMSKLLIFVIFIFFGGSQQADFWFSKNENNQRFMRVWKHAIRKKEWLLIWSPGKRRSDRWHHLLFILYSRVNDLVVMVYKTL